MVEEAKQIVLDYVEAFNRGDLESVCRTFAPEAMIFGVLGWGGLEKAKPIWRELIECFAINLQVEAMIAEGDTVAVRYVEHGRSVAAFRGGPVTGQHYQITAMEWFVIREGKILSRWGARDSAAMFRQMGLALP